jgi:ketosteroid isomerase-like protein
MLGAMRTREQNLDLIRRFWDTLYRRDFDGFGAFFASDGTYVDVPTPDAAGRPARRHTLLATRRAVKEVQFMAAATATP